MIKDICYKYCHFESCRKPCRSVELYLAEDNLTVWSKTATNKHGETIEIIYGRSREIRQSSLSKGTDDRGKPVLTNTQQLAFSTSNESPFAAYQPQLQETGVFIDRFFHKFSYQDLAKKYSITAVNARKRYSHALKRIVEILKALDTKADRKTDYYLKKVEERSGIMPKGQKWFLLNKLFGLRPSEIAELEGIDKKSSSVRQLIIRVSDQLKAGEISLIETTPEESDAAKARLDAQRKKRRKRYSIKKN